MRTWGIGVATLFTLLVASPVHAFEHVSLHLPECFTGAFDASELERALARDLRAEDMRLDTEEKRPLDEGALEPNRAHVSLIPPNCTDDDRSVKVEVLFAAPSGRPIEIATRVTLDDVLPRERSLILAVAILELLRVSDRPPTSTTAVTKPPPSVASPSTKVPPADTENRRASLDGAVRLNARTNRAQAFWGAGVGVEHAIASRWFARVAFGIERAESSTPWGPLALTLFVPEASLQFVLLREPRLSLGPDVGVAIVRARGRSVLSGVEETPQWNHTITLGGRAAVAAPLTPHWRLLVALGLGGHLRRLQLTAGGQELLSLNGALARGEVGVGFDW